MLLPTCRIGPAMKYYFSVDNHTHACVVAPVNGFNSASLNNIATCVAGTSYSCHQDGPGSSCANYIDIASATYCIMAEFCIYNLPGAIS